MAKTGTDEPQLPLEDGEPTSQVKDEWSETRPESHSTVKIEVVCTDDGESSTHSAAEEPARKRKKGPAPKMLGDEVCSVCGDKASGFHYNVLSCEGCKGFFRRSVIKGAQYTCKGSGQCHMDMYMRRKCQECRLKKCHQAGMREECVLSEEQIRKKKIRKQQEGEGASGGQGGGGEVLRVPPLPCDPSLPQPEPAPLTPQQEGMIRQLVAAQQQCNKRSFSDQPKVTPTLCHEPKVDFGSSASESLNGSAMWQTSRPHHTIQGTQETWGRVILLFVSLVVTFLYVAYCPVCQTILHTNTRLHLQDNCSRTESGVGFPAIHCIPWPMGSDPNSREARQQRFAHFTELAIISVQEIVDFAKQVPGFLQLSREDQIALLKASTIEIMLLETARRYNHETQCITFLKDFTYSKDDFHRAGLQVEFINPIFEFSRAMRQLQLDDAEYALLIAINIFSADRPNVQDHGLVEALQQPYIEALSSYIRLHRPQDHLMFPRMLMKLVSLRTLSSVHSEQVFALRLQDKKLPPLLSEIWDVHE